MQTFASPIALAAAVGAVFALGALAIAWLVRSSVVKASMIILALLFLLPGGYLFVISNPGLVDSRFKAYRTFYQEIKVGMTREQVLAALERCYPTNGPRKRPTILRDTPEVLGFFMHPETSSEPNCEGIFLTLESGRVTRKVYSPD
jgi:hypothetical protein